MRGINNSREECKNTEDLKELSHNSVLEGYLNDKMRLCLLNLLNIFIERYEISEYQGFFNIHNASSHPVNLFYCHLASNEINYKLKFANERQLHKKSKNFDGELFEGDSQFNIDFNGKIHNLDEVIALDTTDISNASYIEHLLQGDSWKMQVNNLSKSFQNLDNSEVIKLIQRFSIFKCSFTSEKITIFKILQKVAICNEYTMKMQVENSLDFLSSSHENSENSGDVYGLALSRTQQPFQNMIGLASPTKSMMNTNNMSSFEATGLNFAQRNTASSQNLYWSNGIAYQSDRVNKEKIRRKSDMFLVRVMNSLSYKLSNLNPGDILWCEELSKDLLLLSQYVSKVQSRISIFQIIDTVLNPLIAIKKIL